MQGGVLYLHRAAHPPAAQTRGVPVAFLTRPDSRSSCDIPDVWSSEIELSLEEGRSSPTSSTCTYSSRPDSQSSCGIPDDQSSEIGLSLEEEGCSSASWDHTYSCLPLENSPLEAHADHSYALPQNAVPAHESSGDMADMAPSIYGPSPEDSLSSSAGVLSHRDKCSFILPLAPFCFVLLKCTN
ncbi:uncharacterized protein LOC121832915 [Ixodes scapularis]|uniref:uncharacterized protein LOC121832915 n=1 Tax=Ixodes scapularis TaxID=6945 RepID=UPI001C391B37|nr:uncharacterized protein LOC121832915 [Ixodes scapularis]